MTAPLHFELTSPRHGTYALAITDHRTEIVKQVMRSLEETTDPEELVSAYFDAEREIVVQVTQQTLEATGESPSRAVITERVEAELVEALRFPKGRAGGGLLPTLYVHRGVVALATTLVTIGSALLFLFF